MVKTKELTAPRRRSSSSRCRPRIPEGHAQRQNSWHDSIIMLKVITSYGLDGRGDERGQAADVFFVVMREPHKTNTVLGPLQPPRNTPDHSGVLAQHTGPHHRIECGFLGVQY